MQAKLSQRMHQFHQKVRKERAAHDVAKRRISQASDTQIVESVMCTLMQEENIKDMQLLYHQLKAEWTDHLSVSRESFLEYFQSAKTREGKRWILKLMGVCRQWTEDQFAIAFGFLQEESDMVQDIVSYIGDLQPQLTSSNIECLIGKLYNEGNFVYGSLLAYVIAYKSKEIPQKVFQQILSTVNSCLGDPQLCQQALNTLEQLLKKGGHKESYRKIIDLPNFEKIPESCKNSNIDIHQPAFEVCIDLLDGEDSIGEDLVNKYNFVAIIQQFSSHIWMSVKACWALSNLVTVYSVIPKVLGLVRQLLDSYNVHCSPQMRQQIIYVVVNLINTVDQRYADEIMEIIPQVTSIVAQIADFPSQRLQILAIKGMASIAQFNPSVHKLCQQSGFVQQVEELSLSKCKQLAELSSQLLDLFSKTNDQ